MTASSTSETQLRVLDILPGTSVDGPGLRTSIYFAGCDHRCDGCHNPESWDKNGGRQMSVDEIISIIAENEFPVTFSGGDPLLQAPELSVLAHAIKERLGLEIWCYTGFTIEHIMADERLSQPLQWIDVIVDGPFIKSRRDTSLIFRGSDNQRIINLHPTPKIIDL